MARNVPWTSPPWSVLLPLCILVILLNVFDALSTLEIIRRGGEEANPLMRPLFRFGDAAFFFWKTGLASAGAIALACMSRISRLAWWITLATVAFYAAIACLHVYLLWFIARPA